MNASTRISAKSLSLPKLLSFFHIANQPAAVLIVKTSYLPAHEHQCMFPTCSQYKKDVVRLVKASNAAREKREAAEAYVRPLPYVAQILLPTSA